MANLLNGIFNRDQLAKYRQLAERQVLTADQDSLKKMAEQLAMTRQTRTIQEAQRLANDYEVQQKLPEIQQNLVMLQKAIVDKEAELAKALEMAAKIKPLQQEIALRQRDLADAERRARAVQAVARAMRLEKFFWGN